MGVAATFPEFSEWTLTAFVFVYLHFNVPPTRITDMAKNVSDEKICIFMRFAN